MKKILCIISMVIMCVMLVACGGEYADYNQYEWEGLILASSDDNGEEPYIYLMMLDDENNLVPTIHPNNATELVPYENIVLTAKGYGYQNDEDNSLRTIIKVYSLDEDTIAVAREYAMYEIGGYCPEATTYINVYDYSINGGFVEKLNVKVHDAYSEYAEGTYHWGSRFYFINDEVTDEEAFYNELENYSLELTTESVITNELSEFPQEYELFTLDIWDDPILSMEERNIEMPNTVYEYANHMNVVSSENDEAVNENERTITSEDVISWGVCIFRLILAIVIVIIGLVTAIGVFVSGWAGVVFDMIVIFICTVVIGVDRIQGWLKLDDESVLMLFPVFLIGIAFCAVLDWSKLAGVVYIIQMGLLAVATSGMLSAGVMNAWIIKVGMVVGITSGIPVAIIMAASMCAPVLIALFIVSLLS